jgi:lysophospholipid acyltransferase (LPLAT)-like uncharacterized protein
MALIGQKSADISAMPDAAPPPAPRLKPRLLAGLAAWAIRALGLGWRLRLEDPHGTTDRLREPAPVIWVMWHNSILALPLAYRRWFAHRRIIVLTSASGDGEVLARTVGAFGMGAVRGSSSRHGARALRQLAGVLAGGGDVAITPDGPRGPREVLQPGVAQLAAMTGVPVVPIGVRISRCHRLRSWDAFMVPLPGARVTLCLGPPLAVPRDLPGGLESWRQMLGERLQRAADGFTDAPL